MPPTPHCPCSVPFVFVDLFYSASAVPISLRSSEPNESAASLQIQKTGIADSGQHWYKKVCDEIAINPILAANFT